MKLSSSLKDYLKDGTAREEIVYQLRNTYTFFDHAVFDDFTPAMNERAFMVFGYLATCFINGEGKKPLNRLAKEITIPLVRLAERCQRKPVFDYYGYILCNWQNTPEGIKPLLTFTDSIEEEKYIVSRVEIEKQARCLLEAKTFSEVNVLLDTMISYLCGNRLPESVKSYFCSFSNVMYEGWPWLDPQNFNAEVATQSSVISILARLLDHSYKDQDLFDYKPVPHRGMISRIQPLPKDSYYGVCLGKFYEFVRAMTEPQTDLALARLEKGMR